MGTNTVLLIEMKEIRGHEGPVQAHDNVEVLPAQPMRDWKLLISFLRIDLVAT
jgi:hypothetical protein